MAAARDAMRFTGSLPVGGFTPPIFRRVTAESNASLASDASMLVQRQRLD